MESLDAQCTSLKTSYEQCFNAWFRESFLRGKADHQNACGRLFDDYQKCLKVALEREGLNSKELFEDVLGTEKERKSEV